MVYEIIVFSYSLIDHIRYIVSLYNHITNRDKLNYKNDIDLMSRARETE